MEAFTSASEFEKHVLKKYESKPPVLKHHRVSVDLYHIAHEMIGECKLPYDPEVIFEGIKEYGHSQYLTIKAEAYFSQGNTLKASELAKAAVLADGFYAPAHNLLNRIEGKDDKSIQERFICGLPFTEMQLKTISGKDSMSFCCLQWSPYLMDPIADKQHDDTWNGSGAKEFRRSIIEGDYKYCNKRLCSVFNNPEYNMIPRKEVARESRDTSQQVLGNEARVKRGAELLKTQLKRNEPYQVDRPRHIFIAYDEGCNLACPSCRKEIKQVSSTQIDKMDELFENVVRPLLERGPTILTASGHGDPLGSRHLRKKLPTLSGERYADLKIDLQTNGLLLNQSGWETLRPIEDKIRAIRVSIDAGEKKTYEVLRFPGNWDVLMDSLEMTKSRKNELGFKLILNFCIQECNFREIPSFLKLGERFNADRMNLQHLVNWGTYSAEDYKKRNVVDRSHPDHKEFVDILTSSKRTCMNLQLSSSLPRLLEN